MLHKVLCIDETPQQATELTNILASLGYATCPPASTLAAALKTALVCQPAIVTISLTLPQRTVLAQELKQKLNATVLYVSAMPQGHRTHNVASDGIVLKPYQPHDINQVVGLAMYRYVRTNDKSTDVFRGFFDKTSDPSSIFRIDGTIIEVNTPFANLCGYQVSQLSDQNMFSLINPKHKSIFSDTLANIVHNYTLDYELEIVNSNGTKYWLHNNDRIIEYLGGLAIISVSRDITPRKKLEQEITITNMRLEMALEGGNFSWWTWNYQTGELNCSSNKAKLLGYPQSELEPSFNAFCNMLHQDDKTPTLSVIDKHIESNTPLFETEYRLQAKDGSWKWFHDRGQIVKRTDDNQPLLLAGVMYDITSARTSAQALAKSEEKFRRFFNNTNDPVLISDFDGKILEANQVLCNLLEYTHSELIALTTYHIREFGDSLTAIQKEKDLRNNSQITYQTVILTKTQQQIPVEVNSRLLDYHGKKAIISVAKDMSEHQRFIARQQADQLFLLNILNNLPLAVYVKNTAGEFSMWNSTCELFYDLISPQVVGKTALQVLPDNIAQSNHSQDMETVETGISTEHEELVDSPTLGQRYLHTTKIPLFDQNDQVEYLLSITEDVTEKNIAEEALRESEQNLAEANATKDKLFSIIAHDLRGPIGNTASVLELIIKREMDEDTVYEILTEMHHSAKETYALLEGLLNWSSSQRGTIAFKPQPINIADIIKQCIDLQKSSAHNKGLNLKANLPTSLPVILADVPMITTIIRNLIANAIKFTQSGGTIIVSAIPDNDLLRISIADNGVGISPENIEKLFLPHLHYTTRGTNQEKGTGLGLILCKEFVEKHGGRIWVESELGHGSAFCFALPLAINNAL